MSTGIPELELPIQLFVLGTAVGMLAATIYYHTTGRLERWGLIVAYCALGGLLLGVLLTLARLHWF